MTTTPKPPLTAEDLAVIHLIAAAEVGFSWGPAFRARFAELMVRAQGGR